MIKLPVIAIVLETCAYVWRQRQLFATLALPGIVIMALVGAVQSWMTWNWMNEPVQTGLSADGPAGAVVTLSPGFMLISLAAFTIFMAVIVTIFTAVIVLYSVALHRVYLVTGPAPTARSTYAWQPRQTQFLMAYAKLFLLFIPVGFAAAVPAGFLGGLIAVASGAAGSPQGSQMLVIIVITQLIVWTALGWVWSRMSMLFPAAAVDRPLSLRGAWRMAEGNGWRLFWILGLITLVFLALSLPVHIVIRYAAFESGLVSSLTASLLFALVLQCLTFVWIAASVIALSIAYRLLNPPGGGARSGAVPMG